jgi:hypothetical protein
MPGFVWASGAMLETARILLSLSMLFFLIWDKTEEHSFGFGRSIGWIRFSRAPDCSGNNCYGSLHSAPAQISAHENANFYSLIITAAMSPWAAMLIKQRDAAGELIYAMQVGGEPSTVQRKVSAPIFYFIEMTWPSRYPGSSISLPVYILACLARVFCLRRKLKTSFF